MAVMKTFMQMGDVVTVTAPGAVKSGDLVIVGSLIGVAATNADTGEDVEISLVGIFELPKVTHAGIDQGDPVYWAAPGNCTATGAGNVLIGVCTETAGSSAPKVRVRLGAGDVAALGVAIAALAARVTTLEGA
jgi:predicted RecA/RadA family phage recombinase